MGIELDGREREKEKGSVRTHADNLVVYQCINATVDEQSPGILRSDKVRFAVQRNFNVCIPVHRESAHVNYTQRGGRGNQRTG